MVPKIDPKRRINEMGEKFHYLRFAITFLMSFIFILFTLNALDRQFNLKLYLGLSFGLTLILTGNYFRNLKPNFFIGIRTPWTLENETVWKLTHRFSSMLWVIGGTLVTLANILNHEKVYVWYLSIIIIALLIVIPLYYSYIKFKKLNQA